MDKPRYHNRAISVGVLFMTELDRDHAYPHVHEKSMRRSLWSRTFPMGRSLAADPLIYLYDEMLQYKIILVLEICFVLFCVMMMPVCK